MSKKEENIQTIYYQKHLIKIVGYPIQIRKGICDACHRNKHKGEIKTTQRHHMKYAFETKTVLSNPVLALENSLELCFNDHQIADGLRMLLLANPRGGLRKLDSVITVIKLLPEEQRQHFTRLARRWLKNG